MATIIPFPKTMTAPVRGLTRRECALLDAEAAGLIDDGRASGISTHNNGQYMCVYDCDGNRYFVGREEGMCYLFDDAETMLAESPRFEIVLQALESVLMSTSDEQA